MLNPKNLLRTACLVSCLAAFPAFAQTSLPAPSKLPIVELSAEASRPAANDQVHAVLSAEAAGAALGDLSKQINALIAEALKVSKSYPAVKVQSGNTSTYPIYSKSGKIESWRMRSEISLESGDTAAMSELLGKLQTSLGVSRIVMQPSPETRKKAENEAMLDAIAAFKARAKVIADALGKSYQIKQLSVNTSGRIAEPMFRMAAKSAMSSEAAPMPIEAGESQVTANISGQVELE
ncbi:MAG: SIMPL domain-containing protein [Propionivibrio sp.]